MTFTILQDALIAATQAAALLFTLPATGQSAPAAAQVEAAPDARAVASRVHVQVRGGQGGQFHLKVRLDQASEDWWRPGMTGLAQIDVGDRTILWIWTHRLIDTIRLKLWW